MEGSMRLAVRAYRRWVELKHFALRLTAFLAYGSNSGTIPGPPLPPPDESLKAVTTIGRQPMMWSASRSYVNRRRKGQK